MDVCLMLTTGFVALGIADAAPMPSTPVRVTVDPGATDGAISPLLFGHNLEHTRHAVWRGISAEMLANRKFAGESRIEHWENVEAGKEPCEMVRGTPGPDGVAAHWEGVGGAATRFALDNEIRFAGGPSQRIELEDKDAMGGVRQLDVSIREGVEYAVRLWLRSHEMVRVSARLTGRGGGETYARQSRPLPLGEWAAWEFSWTPSKSDDHAQLEILFEGQGTAWMGAASMMRADNFHGMRRDVIELLKEMSVPLLRWPGGNFTRNYRWKEGLLPVDQRPPTMLHNHQTLPFTDNYDFHDIGIDEFMALCRYLDAEPSIVLNISDSPESAADWVAYCNGGVETKWGRLRAERGHPEPYKVRYWSMGNEIYGRWMGPAQYDSKSYSTLVVRFSEAMRAADPSIDLIACGLEDSSAWTRDVLTRGRDAFDTLSIHYYGPISRPLITDDALAQSRYATREFLGRIQADRDKMTAADKDSAQIPIACDEWNMAHEWMGRPFDHEWHVGPVQGMYLAGSLNMFCRNAKRLNITMAAFFEPVNEGCITVTPHHAFLNAGGQVFKLFRVHHGNLRIILPGEDRKEKDDVDMLASFDEKRGCIVMTVLNRNPREERTVDISIPKPYIVGPASAQLLVAADLRNPDALFEERVGVVTVVSPNRALVTLPPYTIARIDIQTRRQP